ARKDLKQFGRVPADKAKASMRVKAIPSADEQLNSSERRYAGPRPHGGHSILPAARHSLAKTGQDSHFDDVEFCGPW
ncbi:MAG TPA: hypothetical protein VFR05_10940, partial [Terriglobia bacterium]|nr:hypothetical protein [Terriglobia bacterium]